MSMKSPSSSSLQSLISFQSVIDQIDGQGLFQKRLLYLTLTPLLLIVPVAWVNEIFLIHVPDHSCHHPSLDVSNQTQLQLFRECFVPRREMGNNRLEYDNCHVRIPTEMSEETFWTLTNLEEVCRSLPNETSSSNYRLVSCEHGYVFDETNFRRTIATENEWVCDLSLRVPTLLTWGSVGVAVGTVVFSVSSDTLGRRFTLFLALVLAVLASLLKTFVSHIYVFYVVLKTLAAAVFTALYYVPFSLITEIVDNDFRSWTVGYTCLTWAGGLCVLPIVAYLTADWRLLSLVTVGAVAILLLISVFTIPESPRFLLGQGRVAEAASIVRKMASVNKRRVPAHLEDTLKSISDE